MTLCIAVKCRTPLFGPYVVCCFDSQVGNEYEATESEQKWHALSPTACAMFSGPLMPARDLIQNYTKALKRAKALKAVSYTALFWQPMQDFVDANQNKDYLESTDAQLLVVALVEGTFRILTIDANGIREAPYFAAIGTGGDSATAMLRWRKPTNRTPLNAVIYYAYEAKKFGEVSPHVGKRTYINILSTRQKGLLDRSYKQEDFSELDEKFDRLGPQPYKWNG